MEVRGYGIRDKCAFLGEGVGWKLFFQEGIFTTLYECSSRSFLTWFDGICKLNFEE